MGTFQNLTKLKQDWGSLDFWERSYSKNKLQSKINRGYVCQWRSFRFLVFSTGGFLVCSATGKFKQPNHPFSSSSKNQVDHPKQSTKKFNYIMLFWNFAFVVGCVGGWLVFDWWEIWEISNWHCWFEVRWLDHILFAGWH